MMSCAEGPSRYTQNTPRITLTLSQTHQPSNIYAES